MLTSGNNGNKNSNNGNKSGNNGNKSGINGKKVVTMAVQIESSELFRLKMSCQMSCHVSC